MRITLTALLIMTSAALAAPTVEVVELAISAAAIADAPVLSGARCYQLKATTDTDLVGVEITSIVPPTVYNNALGSDAPPNPAFFPVAPSLEFDSYVDLPGTVNIAAGTMGDPLSLPIAYADFSDDGPQTGYVIAQITLLDPGTGYADLQVGQAVNDIHQLRVDLPEPATMSMLALGGLAALRRRR